MANTIPTCHELLLKGILDIAKTRSDQPAFISADDTWGQVSFMDVYNASLSFANFFKQSNVKKGEILTISLPNTWMYLPYIIGSSLVGGASSAMNPDFTTFEMKHQLVNSETTVLLTTSVNVGKIANISHELPHLKLILYQGSDKLVESFQFDNNVKLVNVDTVLKTEPKFDTKQVEINVSEDLFVLPFSSGTTGLPKGVMITHLNFLSTMKMLGEHTARHIAPYVYHLSNESDKTKFYHTVQVLPMFHAYSIGAICGHILNGTSIVIIKSFRSDLLLQTIEKYKIKHVNMIPIFFNHLVNTSAIQNYDLSSLRSIASGGAPLSTFTIQKMKTLFPNVKILQGYGMTEVVSATHLSVFDIEQPLGTVGRLINGCQHKIVNPLNGNDCGIGEVGEIYVKGPNIMKGYWKNEAATREAFTSDGFLKTGDMGYADYDGFLFVKDRKTDMIQAKATQIVPADIEHMLMEHPLVSDCAVVGVHDQANGEVPKAFIVKKDNNLTNSSILDFISNQASAFKEFSGSVQFIEKIPRTATGKVVRRNLKELNNNV